MLRRPTAASRAFWNRVTRRAAKLAPEVRAPLLAGYRTLMEKWSDKQLADFVAQGGVERLMLNVFSDSRINDAFRPLRARMRNGLEEATKFHAGSLPRAMREIAASFDVLHPNVLKALKTLDTRVMTTLRSQIREAARDHVAAGLKAGQGSRQIAEGLREIIPLAPNQAEAVRNFRRALEQADGARSPLAFELRDKRFDATIKKALHGSDAPGLSKSQIDTMTNAYRKKAIAWNAETNARTIANDTFKDGQRMAWDNAIDAGLVEPGELTKTWRGTLDDRERPEHREMEGQTVLADEPFSNGQMIPGDDEFNCRCIPQYGLTRAS